VNVQYIAPVLTLEVLIVLIDVYNIVLGLPLFKTYKSRIDSATGEPSVL
jgi:hypothetical protein